MTTTLARREVYVPADARKVLKLRALEANTTLSTEVASLLAQYAVGKLKLTDEDGASESETVRIRFAIDADVWREVRRRTTDEDVTISSIVRRAIAAL